MQFGRKDQTANDRSMKKLKPRLFANQNSKKKSNALNKKY